MPRCLTRPRVFATIVASAAVGGCLIASPAAPAGALPSPGSKLVQLARGEHCLDFARRPITADQPSSKPPDPISSSFYDSGGTLILAAAANAGSRKAAAGVRREIRHLTTAGSRCKGFENFHTPSSEPTTAGGVSAQAELWATSLFVVARHTPRVWRSLSRRQREAITVIMRASLISNAFVTGDANPYLKVKGQERTIDGGGNVGRDWNPNYREGMIGNVLMGIAYFGVAGARSELDGWNRGRMLRDARRLGLWNIFTTFNWGARHPQAGVPTDADVATAIKGWSYHGIRLTQPMTLYSDLTAFTFDHPVTCGLSNGAGIKAGKYMAGRIAVAAQCSQVPSLGQVGMLHEFDSGDAGGPRSSAIYAYLGFKANLATQVALIAAGTWRHGRIGGPLGTTAELTHRKQIGIDDLFTKLRLGYVSYANGSITTPPGNPRGNVVLRLDVPGDHGHGFVYTEALWKKVILRSKALRADR